MSRPKGPLIVLGLLTAIQAGTAIWRIDVMFQEGLKAGFTSFVPSPGFFEEIALSLALAFIAWWWLPRRERSAASWAIRFIVFAWVLAIGHMAWALTRGFFERDITGILLAVLFLGGTWVRHRGVDHPSPTEASPPGPLVVSRRIHPALVGALIFWLLQLPHLFFPYHWTDTKDIWACRTVAFEARRDLSGIFKCLDPARPPLHSILLWLGHTNITMEGRLLPFLMIGAFGLVVYHWIRRVAPQLAPWGLLWFFMTVRVYQGAVSNYADVPTLVALGLSVFLAVDRGELVPSRWHAVLFALIAGMAVSLIKRDGGALLFVATAVLVWFAAGRRFNPRLYAPLAGAFLGLMIWSFRPVNLRAPAVYAPRFSASPAARPGLPLYSVGVLENGSEKPRSEERLRPTSDRRGDAGGLAIPAALVETRPPTNVPDSGTVTLQTYLTMLYGMQGQILSHYGYGMFVPGWIILAIWSWRRRTRLSREGRLWGWLGVLGWLAIVGIYAFQVATGLPGRASLYVIRTAFGRHLVPMFVFALLSAAALAEVLVYGSPSEGDRA